MIAISDFFESMAFWNFNYRYSNSIVTRYTWLSMFKYSQTAAVNGR